jgi:uncharacterized GH25 family protein
MSSRLPLSIALLALGAGQLSAHECWLQPASFTPAPDQAVALVINVGMDLQGEVREFTPQRVAALRHYSTGGVEDWTARAIAAPEFAPAFAPAGTHVVAYDSTASLITLEPDKFHDYLREEGLEPVIGLREKAGETAKPGRERYRRCNKTILQVGGLTDATWAVRTGQQLEIIPLDDPAAARPGGAMRFSVAFAGQPVADALVLAWHRAGDKLTNLKTRSNATGEVTFTLPASGMWMISTVHMARAASDAEADWASYWGNLTFAVAGAAKAP